MDSNGINESEIFDILFGKSNHNNNVMEATCAGVASNSPIYSSSMSEPGTTSYMIERWEPGEIVDHDHEMGSCSSASSLTNSPVRPYGRHPNRPVRISSADTCYMSGDIRRSSSGKKRGPRPKQLTQEERRQKRMDANDRERQRMGQLNVAFNHLRNVLPKHGNDRELSKFETIHLAKNYIRALNEMLSQAESSGSSTA